MTCNGLKIDNVVIVKNGVAILDTKWREKQAPEKTLCNDFRDLIAIDYHLKKVNKNNLEKTLKSGLSCFVSTNCRDYDNEILYTLYLNEDLIKIEQLEDKTSEGHPTGTTNRQKQFNIIFLKDFIFNILSWYDITQDYYNEKIKEYEEKGYYQSKWKLEEELFKNQIEKHKKALEEKQDELDEKLTTYHKAVIKRSEEKIKQGFVGMIYERRERKYVSLIVETMVYKYDKNANAKHIEKLTKIMKLCNNNISHYDVERMLNYFNISIKRGKNGKENKTN